MRKFYLKTQIQLYISLEASISEFKSYFKYLYNNILLLIYLIAYIAKFPSLINNMAMVKLEDITGRLHTLNKEHHSTHRKQSDQDLPSGKDLQFRPLARDNYAIFIYITLGVAIFGQLILVIFIS